MDVRVRQELDRLKTVSPCVECGHGRGEHQRVSPRQQVAAPAGCLECSCAHFVPAHAPGNRKLLVVTPEQYAEGYACHPHVRLAENRIRVEHQPFRACWRTDQGHYVVIDPQG
jgi:hypothetical protein